MTTVIVGSPKITDTYEPYQEYCPRCQATHTTRIEQTRGNCWWITFVLGCVFFFPLCYWLCCASSKDTKHFCPSCGTLLAIRQGGC
ncbi:hypothetical protein CAEBREN_00709 [Caenorhabditis brenneri]|uniref:LITAF domain-containing protein n=1 Tax=Caenorhabditis brenneri TaxID=135651 RepID=G0NBK8_CAEBE|nr:hypothetical protein CAEBREN_00709 [Caenorhabditis brenneri]